MKKLMVIVSALLFAGSISAAGYHHGCGRGYGYSAGYYIAPRPQVCERVIIAPPAPYYYYAPAPRFYAPLPYAYAYRDGHRGGYRHGGYRR